MVFWRRTSADCECKWRLNWKSNGHVKHKFCKHLDFGPNFPSGRCDVTGWSVGLGVHFKGDRLAGTAHGDDNDSRVTTSTGEVGHRKKIELRENW